MTALQSAQKLSREAAAMHVQSIMVLSQGSHVKGLDVIEANDGISDFKGEIARGVDVEETDDVLTKIN